MVRGIRFEIGKMVDGLWYDSDRRVYDPKGWGIVFSLAYGPGYWKGYHIPFLAGPFLSIAIGPYGLYLGFKNHKDIELVPSASIRRTRWL